MAKKKKKSTASKAPAGNRAMTKSQVFTAVAESTGLPKRDVTAVFDSLDSLISNQIGKRGPGQFTIPGLVKIVKKKKPATKARMGRNPQTGEPVMIKAKPATTVVRVRALKGLKEKI